MAKLKDIADRVGVSISTVSRVMKNDSNRSVSEETRKKIWEAAEQVGYRSLRQNKTKKSELKYAYNIGCVVAMPQNKYNSPYFSIILEGIEKTLAGLGMRLEFVYSIEEQSGIDELKRLVKDNRIDGMLVVERIHQEAYEWLKGNVKTIVGIDLSDPEVPVVSYDRAAAAKEAVRYLIGQGHRRIAYIGGPELDGDFREEKRFLGYRDAMIEAGLAIEDEWVINVKWDVALSYELTKEAFENNGNSPTAIFAASDMMAIAAMRAATERGLRIPEDISFFGVDNISISEFTSPPLSTIYVPKLEMGMFAVKLLVEYAENQHSVPVRIVIPHKCLLRQSSNNKLG
ncbi:MULTISPECIES: LacI family DNA-binding transcriptional regulator [unclassified Paenibacillus]|uniref:LacI family DNA-binding transcriptional regulator n=1 Tax=unclassified Paenibacillus TaxID=185978 RepID=UPI000955110F|nr:MULTISPECIES: LacI family DNA-binding transcriptional regulator [unclassified Paenibacillus]ASS69026.1 LacI family transcriptional regulator [Paenibacillus sp. RUD330]SIR10064.1 LacI family transcriptional regulator [Paenibacillus sp. RU4X]SIR26517.1 LacI family transcriptional regulator [Paenibacillus sp. RU4T]